MLSTVSTEELPLLDLLRFAVENRVTAALELRSDLAVGRIAIRDGEIIDAVFGGLRGEAAVIAASSGGPMSVFRGRAPKQAAERVIALPTPVLLQELASRIDARRKGSSNSGENDRLSKSRAPCSGNQPVAPTGGRRSWLTQVISNVFGE